MYVTVYAAPEHMIMTQLSDGTKTALSSPGTSSEDISAQMQVISAG